MLFPKFENIEEDDDYCDENENGKKDCCSRNLIGRFGFVQIIIGVQSFVERDGIFA